MTTIGDMYEKLITAYDELSYNFGCVKAERDEARAWAKYYRAQFNAVMQEVKARNQAEYAKSQMHEVGHIVNVQPFVVGVAQEDFDAGEVAYFNPANGRLYKATPTDTPPPFSPVLDTD